jgi:hypothetical protein
MAIPLNKGERIMSKEKGSNKLEALPQDIKDDLHYLILQNRSGHQIKKQLEKKWAGDSRLIKADRGTYDAYLTLHKSELEKDENIRKKLVESEMEPFKELEALKSTIESGDTTTVKDQLNVLQDACKKRLEFVVQQQARGFSSPQYESVYVQYLKLLKELLDKTMQYRKEVEEEKDNKTEDIMNTFMQKMIEAVQRVWRKRHVDEQEIEALNSDLSEEFNTIVKDTLEEHDFYNKVQHKL